MPSFTVRSPTGESYTVNGPEGSTQQDAIAYIQAQIAAGTKFEQPKTEEVKVEEPKKDEKPSILAGTTLPPEQPVNPFNSPVGPDEMPTSLYTGDISKMPTAAETKATQFGITPEMGAGEQALRTAKNLAYKASTGFEQTWLGGARLIADATGVGKEGVEGVSKQLSNETQAVQDTFKEHEGLNLASNIGSSILQSVPAMVTGVSAGNMAAYATMYGQSFLQGYDEGRNKDLGVAAATAYGAVSGGAEVLGERLGFPKLTQAIKDVAKGVPASKMASDVAHYLVNDLVGEELTTTIQFLNDAGFGITKYKSVDEALTALVQSWIDTALVTVGQGAVLGGSGMVANSVLKKLRGAHSGGEEGYDLSAAEMVKSAGFNFNRPEQEQQQTQQEQIVPPNTSQEQQATPALTTPPVNTVAGTPIAPVPLDTAEKQIEAKANAPINQAAPELDQRVQQIKEEMGLPHEDAVNMAMQEAQNGAPAATAPNAPAEIKTGNPELDTIANTLKTKYGLSDEKAIKQATEVLSQQKIVSEFGDKNGTQPSNGVNTGPNQSSVPVPQNGPELTGGPAASQSTGLASPVGVAGQPGVRAESVQANEPSALTPEKTTTPPINKETKKWFGDSKAVDTEGKPVVLYRGLVGEVDPQTGRQGYAVFTSDNPYIASSYSGDPTGQFGVSHGAVYPMYAKANEVIEFPSGDAFDKFAFDARAKLLKPGQALVARNVMDTGPRMTSEMASGYEKRSGDVWAFANGTEFKPAIGQAEATKGKRGGGRKPTVKTPEQIAQGKQTAAQQTKDNKAAIAAANEHANILEQSAPERDNFASQEAYLDASMQYRARRNQALDALHEISKGPQRDNAGGRKAKEALAHPSISTQERTSLQQRIALKNQPAARVSKSNTKTTSATDKRYEGFKTTQQALNHIIEHGTPFEKFLARRLQPFLKGVNFVIVRSIDNVPNKRVVGADGKTLRDSFDGANGMYATYKENGKEVRTIFLRSTLFGSGEFQGTNNTVFLHEALHAAINARINEYMRLNSTGKPIPAKLQKAIDGLYKARDNAEAAYLNKKLMGEPIPREVEDLFNNTEAFFDLKEFVSYGMTTDAMQQFLLETKGEIVPNQPGKFRSLFNGFVNSVREMFGMDNTHMSAMQDLMVVSEGLLRYELQGPTQEGVSLAKKSTKAKEEKISQAEQKIRVSNNAHEIGKSLYETLMQAKGFDDIREALSTRWNSLGAPFINKTLKVLPTADILRWVKDIKLAPNMEEIKDKVALKKVEASLASSMLQFHGILSKLDDMAQNMSSMRTRMREAYDKKSQQVKKFVYAQAGNSQALSNAMHYARLAEISPTMYANVNEAIAKDKKLSELDTKINEPGREAKSKSALEGQKTRRTTAIKEAFKYWDELGKRDGGHETYKMVRQFYRDNLTLTRTLLDTNISKLNIEEADKQKLMSYIRKMQEDSKVGEYFPFLRHGVYWFNMTKGPAGREFILFDTAAERDAYMNKRAKELNLSVADRRERFSAGNDITALSHKDMHNEATAALKEMFEIIDNSGDTVDKNTLKDQLYQTWLQTTSESSFRKQFLHADNVAGFSADVLRNFDTTAKRYASQLPRLKFSPDMTSAVQQARDFLNGMDEQDQIKLGEFINEMASRADQEFDPAAPNKIATALNQIAYYWLLTGPASAATQIASIPIMVYPALIADYGPIKATKIMAKYSNVWKSMGVARENATGETEWVAPTVAESKIANKNPAVKKAFELAKEKYNLFALTNTSILANIHRTPATENQNFAEKMGKGTLDIMSSLFNGAERISRETTFAMFFELEYAKTKDMDASVHKAVSETQEILGRYDSMNRPTVMRNFAGKTLGQFKQYAFNVTSYLVRNGHGMFKHGLLEEEGRAAGTRLVGTLLMGGLFHGMVGMPLYSVICAAVDFALKNLVGDDDEEKKRRRRENPVTADNSNLRFRYEYLPKLFGDAKINGVPLSTIAEKGPISALTNWNIGSRTSFDGMWFREAKPGKTAVETVQNTILANLGPGATTGINAVGAIDDFSNGHIERGIEKLVPAIFKNPLVAYRLATKGAETKNADRILKPEEFSKSDIFGQALGFQSTKLARLQEEGFESNKEIIGAANERQQILHRLDEALMDPEADDADRQKVINIVRQFNNRYPDPDQKLLIDGDAIDSSIDKLIEAKGLTLYGQRMTEANMAYLSKLRRAAAPPEK